MTLISAWRAAGGIVLHADSQETFGDYRVTVQKIRPETVGTLQIIVAGAGQPGSLVDSFAPLLKRRITAGLPLPEFARIAEEELAEFYKADVRLCPNQDKTVKFLIAASDHVSHKYDAWVTDNIRLNLIVSDRPTLAGWDEPLYQIVADRMYSPEISIAQAVLAGIYLLVIAEGTSNYVKGPFSVAVIRENGIWMEQADYLREVEWRLKAYEQTINRLFLACADTEVLPSKLKAELQQFGAEVSSLHLEHITAVARKMIQMGLQTNDAYAKIPLGTEIEIDQRGGFKLRFPEER